MLRVAPPRKTRPPDHIRVNWPVDASASGLAQVGPGGRHRWAARVQVGQEPARQKAREGYPSHYTSLVLLKISIKKNKNTNVKFNSCGLYQRLCALTSCRISVRHLIHVYRWRYLPSLPFKWHDQQQHIIWMNLTTTWSLLHYARGDVFYDHLRHFVHTVLILTPTRIQLSLLPIIVIFFRGCLSEVVLPSHPVICYIGSIRRQPNYPKQLAPKRGSQSSLSLDPNLTWWAYRTISLLFRPGTLPAGGLISQLSSPAFDGAFDHLQLIRVTLIFKMQKAL